MRRKSSLIPILAALPLVLSVALVPHKIEEANAASSLPTTIYLKDNAESEVRGYYDGLSSLSATERQGEALLKNLKPILSKDQKLYNYDKGDDIWKMYEIIDRDWKKSPASEITRGSYNSSTNTITDYQYTTSYSAKENNPYVHALYVDRTIDNPKTAWDEHTKRSSNKCIEREHIWPKSHGFDEGTASGARGDPMHLWAADGGTNGMHSNNFYGNVDKEQTYKSSKTSYAWTGNNYSGKSLRFKDSTQTVFEPQDSDKGDIARACFYMVARYNNISGTDTSIDGSNPNLVLNDDISKNGTAGQSTATEAYNLGILSDLLEWNRLDPVDEFEIHRNNILFNNYTNNRNPFIDFPEWADLIWGDAKTTKSADPKTDKLNGGNAPTPTPTPEPTPEKEKTIFGLKPIVFYIICGAVGVVVLTIIIVIAKTGSKKQKKALKKAAKKAIKTTKKKRK